MGAAAWECLFQVANVWGNRRGHIYTRTATEPAKIIHCSMKTATLAITEKHTQGARFIVNKINVAFMQVAKETCLSAAQTDVRIQITKQNGGTPRYSPPACARYANVLLHH